MQKLFSNVNWGSLNIYDHKTEDERRKGLPLNMRGQGMVARRLMNGAKLEFLL